MPKVKQRQLRDQFTIRIYNEDESNILKRAYQRFQTGFDTISDFIRHCVIIGAEKLMTDNTVDQRMNLDEIKVALHSIDNELKLITRKMDFTIREQQIDNYVIENLLNFIAAVTYSSDCNKEVATVNSETGLFNLTIEKLKAVKKVLNE